LYINDKILAHQKDYLSRIEKASAVFFSGGDQFRISTIIGGTPILDILKKKYYHNKSFILAGTSSGAMAMAKIMIHEAEVDEAILKDNLHVSSGLGFFNHCIIDTHFIKRGRIGRLCHAVLINPDLIGIGLAEDTALIIKKSYEATCIGSGMVIIIDAHGIKQTNITEEDNDSPIFVENLKVHILTKGCSYNCKTRVFKPPVKI
jgi:cyanophycinase